MNVSRAAIEQDRLLAGLDPSIARLAARGIVRSYRKNTIVLNEGEPGDSLFVLLQGQVKVYATDENGREITYGTIQAGHYFGEMSLDGGARSIEQGGRPARVSEVNKAVRIEGVQRDVDSIEPGRA